jgi:hypothetical protein
VMATPADEIFVLDDEANVMGSKKKVLGVKSPPKRKVKAENKAHVLLWVPQNRKSGTRALSLTRVLSVYKSKDRATSAKERLIRRYEDQGYLLVGDKLVDGYDHIGVIVKPTELFFDEA